MQISKNWSDMIVFPCVRDRRIVVDRLAAVAVVVVVAAVAGGHVK